MLAWWCHENIWKLHDLNWLDSFSPAQSAWPRTKKNIRSVAADTSWRHAATVTPQMWFSQLSIFSEVAVRAQPWPASTVLSKLQVVPALTLFQNRKPSFCFLSLRQVLPPRVFVVFRPHCKVSTRGFFFRHSSVFTWPSRDTKGSRLVLVLLVPFHILVLSLGLETLGPLSETLWSEFQGASMHACCMTAAWFCLKQPKFDTTSITPDLERIWKNEAHHIHTSLQLSHQKGIIKCRCAT